MKGRKRVRAKSTIKQVALYSHPPAGGGGGVRDWYSMLRTGDGGPMLFIVCWLIRDRLKIPVLNFYCKLQSDMWWLSWNMAWEHRSSTENVGSCASKIKIYIGIVTIFGFLIPTFSLGLNWNVSWCSRSPFILSVCRGALWCHRCIGFVGTCGVI